MSRRFQFSLRALLVGVLALALLLVSESYMRPAHSDFAIFAGLAFWAWAAFGAAIGVQRGDVDWFASRAAIVGLFYIPDRWLWFLAHIDLATQF